MSSKKEIIKAMKVDYAYPDPDDEDLQEKIYKKREFQHKIPHRKILKTTDEIRDYQEKVCGRRFAPFSHQSFISNFINPNTPYKGLLIFHGVGTGKTCGAIAIAENFKDNVKKYGTKIYVLTPGPLIKQNWKDELIKCTGETYMKDIINEVGYVDEYETNRAKKEAMNQVLQYYKIMSYRSFYRKVLGEKIVERRGEGDETKTSYRRTEEGEIERDLAIDKIDNLNNSLLIVDEAHRLTGNEYGDALKKIIRNSKNLRVILLTATPMKNLADDIIDLLNFIRPKGDKINRDKVFTKDRNYKMNFRKGGEEYLKKMANGYVSHYRGANPLTFAKRVDIGEIPDGLIFTKVVQCFMEKFQLNNYREIIAVEDDSLDKRAQAVSNFVFPGLSEDKKSLKGLFSTSGIISILSQLKNHGPKLLQMINKQFFKGKVKDINSIMRESDQNKNISGLILQEENLKHFSIKFYTALTELNKLVKGQKGAGTAFIYSNLVRVGIDLFQEVLLQNGYLEYDETGNYQISDNTRDYLTGMPYSEFQKKVKDRKFHPATFITITGGSEEKAEVIPEVRKFVLDNVFNNVSNIQGKYIKFILGSKVMQEGITLENVKELHILDVSYHLGQVHQVIGRAIRQCKHYNVATDENPFPEVKVYKYTASLQGKRSSEEELYRKAELKYIMVKRVERVLKEVAVDCPTNYHGNMFPEEIEKHKNCRKVDLKNPRKKDPKACPVECDFVDCHYQCHSKKLNLNYYDRSNKFYKSLTKEKLDYSTFNSALAADEIRQAKDKIKEMFKFKYVYTLKDIINFVKDSYPKERKDLFDEFFVYKGLDDMIPITENDFNNFKDTIYDKYNVPGYLIYRHSFYIFQPFDQNEDVPMHYRTTYNKSLLNDLSIFNYMKKTDLYKESQKLMKEIEQRVGDKDKEAYDFDSVRDYYDAKEENDYIGIIDKSGRRREEQREDVFKIRPRREKILTKKRGTGIPSAKGAVCYTSKSKDELTDLAVDLGLKEKGLDKNRVGICQNIKTQLLYLEKYTTGKNKKTYMIIPGNHPVYPFPYNLEDRVKDIIFKMEDAVNLNLGVKVKREDNGIFEGKRSKEYDRYVLTFKDKGDYKKHHGTFKERGFELNGGNWQRIIE